MQPEPKKSEHWPFTEGASETDAAAGFREALERKHARESVRAAGREHMRHDRLIVGGRAHAKKRGLS
ncbi:MAG: hypothetical protein EG823_00235 [Actinobacteria bacterium]|nr:hypothetical protein [Actinomycetota bacterium]